jgi:hypothetical protein
MFGTYVYVSKYLSVIVMVDWYRARGELGSNRRMILRITGDAILWSKTRSSAICASVPDNNSQFGFPVVPITQSNQNRQPSSDARRLR